jgi:hypothetical protein
MSDPFGKGELKVKKADGVADAINKLLANLSLACSKEEGIRNYFYVGVLGYGVQVGPALGGTLATKEVVSIEDIACNPVRIEMRTKKTSDGAGGLIEEQVRFPIWFDPAANGGTPMCLALGQARSILQGWITQHPDCFPPIVINFTDGESTDGDPTPQADAIKQLESSDGKVLFFNVHLSSQRKPEIEFPSSEEILPDQFAKLLFRMSSPLTPFMLKVAAEKQYAVTEGARGFVFQAELVTVIDFLDIGTRPSNLR